MLDCHKTMTITTASYTEQNYYTRPDPPENLKLLYWELNHTHEPPSLRCTQLTTNHHDALK